MKWVEFGVNCTLKAAITSGVVYLNILLWQQGGTVWGKVFISLGSILFMPCGIYLPNGKKVGWTK